MKSSIFIKVTTLLLLLAIFAISLLVAAEEENRGGLRRRRMKKGKTTSKTGKSSQEEGEPKIKAVIHIQTHCQLMVGSTDVLCSESHALNAVTNVIKDYEGIRGLVAGTDYEIVVVLNNRGGIFALDPYANDPHAKASENHSAAHVQELIDQGVQFKLCKTTSTTLSANPDQLIEGVEFVDSGVTTVIDLQQEGYSYYPAL